MSNLLAHLEKTLTDNYRKEIDQEENVWRTLPFFIAALALELAELNQLRGQLNVLPLMLYIAVLVLGILALATAIAALFFLERSIRRASFKYIASEPDLASYARDLIELEDTGGIPDGSGLTEFREQLVRQLAAATDNNRGLNQRRMLDRANAGTLTMISLLASLALGTVVVASQLNPERMEEAYAAIVHPRGAAQPPAGIIGTGKPSGPTPDAGRDQGPVHATGRSPNG